MAYKRYLIVGDNNIAEQHEIQYVEDTAQNILGHEIHNLKKSLIRYKDTHPNESLDIDLYLSKLEDVNLDNSKQKFAGYFKDMTFAFWIDSPKYYENSGFIYSRIFEKDKRYLSGFELGNAFNEKDMCRLMRGFYFNEFQDFFGMDEAQTRQALGYSLGAVFN